MAAVNRAQGPSPQEAPREARNQRRMRAELNELVAMIDRLPDHDPALEVLTRQYTQFLQSLSERAPFEQISPLYTAFLFRLAGDESIALHPIMQRIRGWLTEYQIEPPPPPEDAIDRAINDILRREAARERQMDTLLDPARVTLSNFDTQVAEITALAQNNLEAVLVSARQLLEEAQAAHKALNNRLQTQEELLTGLEAIEAEILTQIQNVEGQVDWATMQRYIIQQKILATQKATEEVKPPKSKGLLKAIGIALVVIILRVKIPF